ncbi:DNA-binding transcriptional repressor [Aeromonas allosaccharophila]|uniref:glucitol operon DNA-binding transcriptional repressor SrlR n=1 Tax=Aeromonas allosaccharophila TaxID=656 RepID=UPI0030067F8C
MNNIERRELILQYLKSHGRTSVNDLAGHFSLTGATIRSDLRALELENKIVRCYGGAEARVLSVPATEQPMNEKTKINQEVKSKIAQAAVFLVDNGESLILDNGSTTLQMVKYLKERTGLSIMTNSLAIMNKIAALDCDFNLLVPGGVFRKHSASFHGQQAEQTFNSFTFDKLFIGADGFNIDTGTTTFNESFQVSQAMAKAARQIIVVTDSEKFKRKTPNVVIDIKQIDVIITDTGISNEDKNALQAKNIKVITV